MTDTGPVDDGLTLDVRPNLSRNPFRDLADEQWHVGALTRAGVLPEGTVDGRPALLVVIELTDGSKVAGTLPYAAAEVAARALAAVWSADQ